MQRQTPHTQAPAPRFIHHVHTPTQQNFCAWLTNTQHDSDAPLLSYAYLYTTHTHTHSPYTYKMKVSTLLLLPGVASAFLAPIAPAKASGMYLLACMCVCVMRVEEERHGCMYLCIYVCVCVQMYSIIPSPPLTCTHTLTQTSAHDGRRRLRPAQDGQVQCHL